MADQLTGELITDESSNRATPIGMDEASGSATFNTDQTFLTLADLNVILADYLHISGGLFTLENEVDFGANFGVASAYIKDRVVVDVFPTNNIFLGIGYGKKISWANSDELLSYDLEVVGTDLVFNGAIISSTGYVDGAISAAIGALSSVYQPLDGDLTAISNLAGTGFAVKTAADTWVQRSIAVAARLSVSNGDGVAGNPTLDLTALTANRAIVSDANGFPSASSVTATEVGYLSGAIAPIQTQFAGVASTGVRYGGQISINADPTKFDVAEVSAVFISHPTPSSTPVITYVTAGPFTAQTVTNIGTQLITYLALASNGTIAQFSSPLTPSQRRDYAELGAVVHSNLTTINAVNSIVTTTGHGVNQVHDLMEAIGPINITGNKYTANGANLNVNVSAGTIFKLGSNFHNNEHDPHRVSLSSGTAITFRYRRQNSVEGSDVTSVDPDNYDVGGVLTSVPNNKFTVQRFVRFQSGLTRVQYGQHVYDNLNEAVAGVSTEAFVTETNMAENGVLRAYLVVKQGTTALNSVTDALFMEAQKFGGAAANAGAALTSANIIAALGYTPANVAGDTFTGNVSISNTNPVLTLTKTSGTSNVRTDYITGGTTKLIVGVAGAIDDLVVGSVAEDAVIRVRTGSNLLISTDSGGSAAVRVLTTSGFVGIGGVPATKFQVTHAGLVQGRFYNTTNGTDLRIVADTDHGGVKLDNAGMPLLFSLGGSEAARFAATTRNLLINTTTDDGTNKLQVAGSGAFTGTIRTTESGVVNDSFAATGATTNRRILRLGNTGGDAIFGIDDSAGGTTIVGASAYDAVVRGPSGIAFSANGGTTLHARIASTGSLSVNSSAQVVETITSSDSAAYMRYINSGNSAVYTGSTSSGDFDIQTTATTRARVTSGGNFLIGTTTDDGTNKLQVNGSTLLAGTTKVYNSATDAVFRVDSVSARAFTEYQLNSVVKAFVGVGSASNDLITGSVAGSLSLRTQGASMLFSTDSGVTSAMLINSSGRVILGSTGDDGVNKLQVNGNINVLGGGIKFPATQVPSADANTLDDYEEGTWTPELRFGNATTGITYTTQSGHYTKIGNLVTATCMVVLSSNGTATGNAEIYNLPYTVTLGRNSPVTVFSSGISYTGSLNFQAEGTTTRIALQQVTEAGSNSYLSEANFSDTASLTLSVTYLV